MSESWSESTLECLRNNLVDVVVTADQTFIKFLCANEKVLVPTGMKRMGSTVKSDDKRKGVTLMLTAYVRGKRRSGGLEAGLLPPFMVFNGKIGKTLDKRYKDWSRRPGHSGSMNFQSKHWFDGVITLRWINWLVAQFPDYEKLGMIWDDCPSHKFSGVIARLSELENMNRLISILIPPGMTSILQLGDIAVNAPCKKFLRQRYLAWQFAEIQRRKAKGVTGRLVVKIDREILMTWAEEFIDNFNFKESTGETDIIIPVLTKVGQNCFTSNLEPFQKWLDSLNKNALYKSLLESHTAVDL